jgi:hypothetical protein
MSFLNFFKTAPPVMAQQLKPAQWTIVEIPKDFYVYPRLGGGKRQRGGVQEYEGEEGPRGILLETVDYPALALKTVDGTNVGTFINEGWYLNAKSNIATTHSFKDPEKGLWAELKALQEPIDKKIEIDKEEFYAKRAKTPRTLTATGGRKRKTGRKTRRKTYRKK